MFLLVNDIIASISSTFPSTRERRLWTWTLIVVVAIYSILGLTRTLAGILRDNGLLNISFVLDMFLVGTAVVALVLKARPGGYEIGVGLGIVAVYFLLFLRMGIPEERTHLIKYGVVAIFIHEALAERKKHRRSVPMPALLAILTAALIGAFNECIQLLLPNRVFDLRDILFNGLAG